MSSVRDSQHYFPLVLSLSKHEWGKISPFDKLRANGNCSTNF